jgi:hypothetical protein
VNRLEMQQLAIRLAQVRNALIREGDGSLLAKLAASSLDLEVRLLVASATGIRDPKHPDLFIDLTK